MGASPRGRCSLAVCFGREEARYECPATAPIPAWPERRYAPPLNPSVRNGYRFAKYEGESIVTIVEKYLKTAGFCDSTRRTPALCSRSIHRDV
ncbi:MAG: hypothetical protein V4602_05600 [Pseudomonadota bacterium]